MPILVLFSKPWILRWCRLSQISSSTPTFITCQDTWIPQTWYDNTWCCSFSRWSLQKGYLWTWPLHCGLSWTGTSGLHCARLVSKVLCVLLTNPQFSNIYSQMYCPCKWSWLRSVCAPISATYWTASWGVWTGYTLGEGMSRVTPGYLRRTCTRTHRNPYPWVSDLITLYNYNIKIKYLIYKK